MFIPGVWDLYQETWILIDPVVSTLHDYFGSDVKIIAAGHSLGGGLAQYAGYCSQHITTVYAFNPSPVAGYYSVAKTLREKNSEKLRILRMYEHGEVLACLRLVLRHFYPLSYGYPRIIEIRFNFNVGNVITEHGMEKFAHGLQSFHA